VDEIGAPGPPPSEPPIELRPIGDIINWNNAQVRWDISKDVMHLFKLSNLFVLVGVGVIFFIDTILMFFGYNHAADRLIDSKVIMTLIGATAVQLGSIAILMARSLYSSSDNTVLEPAPRLSRTGRRGRQQKPPAQSSSTDDEIV
jgi:hypothetical protein